MIWAYGVTTVLSRRDDLLPRTLASLRAAGFNHPTLFVDGITHAQALEYEHRFPGHEVVTRHPNILVYGNWILALAELYIRNPKAERYAIFQDDLLATKNLKAYLEVSNMGEKEYQNLYLFQSNMKGCPLTHTGRPKVGWFISNQLGRGAVGLVFNRMGVVNLLTHQHMVEKPMCPRRGHKNVDGGVVTAMNLVGYREMVHYPSLLQHVGMISSMGNLPHAQAVSFRGEDFDAMELRKEW